MFLLFRFEKKIKPVGIRCPSPWFRNLMDLTVRFSHQNVVMNDVKFVKQHVKMINWFEVYNWAIISRLKDTACKPWTRKTGDFNLFTAFFVFMRYFEFMFYFSTYEWKARKIIKFKEIWLLSNFYLILEADFNTHKFRSVKIN